MKEAEKIRLLQQMNILEQRIFAIEEKLKIKYLEESRRVWLDDIQKKDIIVQAVCDVMNTSIERMSVRLGSREKKTPKWICCYFLRLNTRMTLGQIGAVFGGWDHSGVRSSIEKIENYITTKDEKYLPSILNCKKLINERINSYSQHIVATEPEPSGTTEGQAIPVSTDTGT